METNKQRKMKILQISAFDLPTRNDLMCGGTQRVVLSLDSSYVKKGLESYVVATSDSEVVGELLPTIKQPLWEYDREVTDSEKKSVSGEHYRMTLEHILDTNPDVIHDQARFVFSDVYKMGREKIKAPIIVSIHSNFVHESEIAHLKGDENIWIVAISEDHRRNLERLGLDVRGMVYHGLDLKEYPFEENKMGYMFSIGRIVPDKGQDMAIRVAKKTGRGLIIAGKILPYNGANSEWWEKEISGSIDRSYVIEDPGMVREIVESVGQDIIWVNGVRNDVKKEFYKYASCLILPTKSEACNLTVLESLASGTPVIASNVASLPEQVINGENGYLADNEEEMVEAVKNLGLISPSRCREIVRERFSLEDQVDNYLGIYRNAIEQRKN